MSLEFELPLVSFIFLLILNIIYFSKKRVDLPENKLYKVILICSLLEAFIDTIIHLICSVNTFDVIVGTYYPLFNYLNKILSSLFVIIFSCLFCYTVMITYKKVRENPKTLMNTMIIINIIFMIVMLFTDITLVDAGLVTNVTGPTIALGYGVVAVLLTASLTVALTKANKIDRRYLPIFLVLVIMGFLFMFTLLFPGMIIYDLVLALMCYIMYFTIENPDMNMLKELDYQKEQVETSKNISNKVINTISDNLSESVNKLNTFGHKKINYEDSEELKKEISDIQKFSLEFVSNINSLLELSKTQSEGFVVQNNNYEPLQMINEITDLLNTKNKKVKVSINKDDDIPAVLYGDPVKIKQCILHMYNGIINIAKIKNIEFNISYLIVGSLCRFKLNVEVDTKDLNKEYSKNMKDSSIDFEVTERIVKLLEGKFNITSENSKVRLELSIDQKYIEGYYIKDEIKSTTNKKIDYIDLSNKKVLIIDDDKKRTDEIMHLLSNYKIEAIVAHDYNSTKKEATENMFDLVIVDDITSELERIKNYLLIDDSNGLLKVMDHIEYDVPRVIMVTPNTKDYETKFLEEGFDEILTKPIDKYKLDKILKVFLEETQKQDM